MISRDMNLAFSFFVSHQLHDVNLEHIRLSSIFYLQNQTWKLEYDKALKRLLTASHYTNSQQVKPDMDEKQTIDILKCYLNTLHHIVRIQREGNILFMILLRRKQDFRKKC